MKNGKYKMIGGLVLPKNAFKQKPPKHNPNTDSPNAPKHTPNTSNTAFRDIQTQHTDVLKHSMFDTEHCV